MMLFVVQRSHRTHHRTALASSMGLLQMPTTGQKRRWLLGSHGSAQRSSASLISCAAAFIMAVSAELVI